MVLRLFFERGPAEPYPKRIERKKGASMTLFIAWGQRVAKKDMPQPPGNSLAIIDRAYELGYDGIELDLRLAKDGKLVLMHDQTIDKTTFGVGSVSKMTSGELAGIQLRDPFDGPPCYVPLFSDALRVNGARGPVMCDLRQIDDATLRALKQAVEEAKFDERRLIFIPYKTTEAMLLKQAFPSALVMLKAPISLKPPELTVDFVRQAQGVEAILVPTASFPELTTEFRAETSRLGMKLGIYLHHRGLDSLIEVLKSGVDMVTTVSHTHFAAAREAYATLPKASEGPSRRKSRAKSAVKTLGR